MSTDAPTFEVIGEPSQQAIEALARLLLATVDEQQPNGQAGGESDEELNGGDMTTALRKWDNRIGVNA